MIGYIGIRLPYHRNVYVARICGRSTRYRFERDFHCVQQKREIADSNRGSIKWRVVYYLPQVAAVYEVRDEQSRRYYIGTRPGDPALYAVSLSRIEALIDGDPDIDDVIGSKVEHFKQHSAVQEPEPKGAPRTRDGVAAPARDRDEALAAGAKARAQAPEKIDFVVL